MINQNLTQIIKATDGTGLFELGNIRVGINDKKELQNELIHSKPPPYHN
jgi:hypothetical protein